MKGPNMNMSKDTDPDLMKHVAGQAALQTLVRFTLVIIILIWSNRTLFPYITTWLEILTKPAVSTTTTTAPAVAPTATPTTATPATPTTISFPPAKERAD